MPHRARFSGNTGPDPTGVEAFRERFSWFPWLNRGQRSAKIQDLATENYLPAPNLEVFY